MRPKVFLGQAWGVVPQKSAEKGIVLLEDKGIVPPEPAEKIAVPLEPADKYAVFKEPAEKGVVTLEPAVKGAPI